MENDDWDIFSIVRSCYATSFTTPTTTFETPHPPEIQTTSTITSNNIISYQNTTPSCFDDFTFTQENRSVPFAPLKPTDFVELDKLMIKSNSTTTTTIPTPTTISIPTIITTATSYPTTTITTVPTPSTNTIPTHITNINTSVHAFNQNSTFYDFPELIDLQQMQSNESIELENLTLIFNPTPTTTTTTPNITTPTTTTPTSISHITPTTTSTTPTTTTITSKTTTTTTIPTPTTTSILTIITTATSSPTTNITIIPTPSANTISTHIINNIAPTTTTPTSISSITTTTTSTTPTPIIITSKTTTHTIPTITTAMTSTSARETNQYPSSNNFPMLVEQRIQTNNKNQVFVHKPVACIEITTAHFDRAYNHPSIPKQPPRESNLPPVIPPQNSSRVLPDTQPQQSNCETRKRKNNNQVVCYVTEDKLSEDSWAWKKYGQKPIKGSPHPRSYYRCSTFTDCFARKLVEKCKTKENTYIVTYRGEHNHNKPELNKNYVVGTSKSKPSETRLPVVREAESSSNIKNLGLPNVAMLRFDQPESSNSQVLVDQSKIPYAEKELIETQSHAALEVGSSLNVANKMMQFDEPESSNAQVFPSESKFPCSETRLIGSSDDEDNVLIPNITAMSEDFLLNFNHLNKGILFP